MSVEAMGRAATNAVDAYVRMLRADFDGHGSAFADFYEQHTNGSWTDLGPKYAAFQSGKDSSSE